MGSARSTVGTADAHVFGSTAAQTSGVVIVLECSTRDWTVFTSTPAASRREMHV